MLSNVYQPAAKKIECEKCNNYCPENICMEPVYKANIFLQTPVTKLYNYYCKKSMDDEVHRSKAEVNSRMPPLRFSILQCKQWYGAFQYPEKKQAGHQHGHALQGVLIQCLKIGNDAVKHTMIYTGS